MAQLVRFDEVAGLVNYFNAVDNPPTFGTGSEIDELPPGYDSVGEVAVQSPDNAGQKVTFDSATIGQMPAWEIHGGSFAGLLTNHSQRVYPNGMTVVTVVQTPAYEHIQPLWQSIDGTTTKVSPRQNSGNHMIDWTNTSQTFTETLFQVGVPMIHVLRQGPNAGETNYTTASLWCKDSVNGLQQRNVGSVYTTNSSTGFYLGSKYNSSATFRGYQSIFAVYDSELSDTDLTDVITLCETWIASGTAPEAEPLPTKAKFQVLTNDPTSKKTWYCARTIDSGEWKEAETTLSDATVTTELGQDNDTLLINSGQTPDSGQIRCVATTPYNPGGITSAVAELNVVESS